VRAEEGSTASTATFVAALDQEHPQRVDGGGLADTGETGDATRNPLPVSGSSA